MLSYARNAEDVVLARALDAQASGFYVDVGADHPERGSVTKHFYDRGWHGINVVPDTAGYTLFCEARPRDINLRLAPSDRRGQGHLYTAAAENRDGWTLHADVARRRGSYGAVSVEVELLTLADVCAQYATGPIDFLRIDLEDSETEVVQGGDWQRHRPRALVVAVTEPGSEGSRPAPWETLVSAAGYQFALFDGLNRFYVRAEDAALLPRLAAPANAQDAWEPHRYVSKIAELERHVASLGQQVIELQAHSDGVMRYATDAREHFERCQGWARVLEGKLRSCEEHFERSQIWVQVLERKVRCFEEYLGLLPGTLPPPRA
jgi:FkbM family methyltransferase